MALACGKSLWCVKSRTLIRTGGCLAVLVGPGSALNDTFSVSGLIAVSDGSKSYRNGTVH